MDRISLNRFGEQFKNDTVTVTGFTGFALTGIRVKRNAVSEIWNIRPSKTFALFDWLNCCVAQ